jgi:DNA-binding NtrC family response regulator
MTTQATQMCQEQETATDREEIDSHRMGVVKMTFKGARVSTRNAAHSLQVVALGSATHFEAIRKAAALCCLEIRTTTSPDAAIRAALSNQCDVLVAELPYCDLKAEEFLDSVRQSGVLVIFRVSDGQDAANLTDTGAYSVVDAGADEFELTRVMDRAADEVRSRREADRQEVDAWRRMLVGTSSAMREIARTIELVANRRCTVLISGETGTGKEMVARAIHLAGDRARKPFIPLNCSAIPEHLLEAELFGHTRGAFTGAMIDRPGRFEEADGGTLFLDEIGDMPFDLQAKLLRVLQEREVQRLGSSRSVKVNVRVIAASNLDLLERVKQKQFREDLYYRLNVMPIHIAALRERSGDIALLARHFVHKICRLEGIPTKQIYNETLEELVNYNWPGNVRQLENVVERAVVISGDRQVLMPADFPLPASTPRSERISPAAQPVSIPNHGIDFTLMVTNFEKTLLDQALERSNGNKSAAADLLRLKRSTLVSKLRVMEQCAA